MGVNIYDLLPIGEKNAISRRELMNITGYTDRQLRRQIADERRAGALILSSTDCTHGGYFRHEEGNAAELRRFINFMSSHGRATFAVLKTARKVLAEMEQAEVTEEAAQNGEIRTESVSPVL